MTIFGSDDRLQITDTRAAPYRSVVWLQTEWPDGSVGQGSGVLVGDNDVLTAGHCVFNPLAGGYATRITIIAAADGASAPYGTAHATALHMLPDAVDAPTERPDLALITIDRALGKEAGFLPVAALDRYAGVPLDLVGYPADKPSATMWHAIGTAAGATPDLFIYRGSLDGMPGMSGGPLLAMVDGRQSVVGLHVQGLPDHNAGTRISDFLAAVTNYWIANGDTGFMGALDPDAANTRATAAAVAAPYVTRQTVGEEDPRDCWSFTATEDGVLTIDVGALTGNAALTVHRADGSVLARSDHYQTQAESASVRLHAGETCWITVELVTRGVASYRMQLGFGADAAQGLSSIRGGAGADELVGGSGRDELWGGDGPDLLLAGGGNDVLHGGAGDDLLDGGAGWDVAVFDGIRSNFRVSHAGETMLRVAHVSGHDTDLLHDVEMLQFDDGVLVHLDGAAASVARLYSASFARAPDLAGLTVQLDALSAGTSVLQLAQNFINSAEFLARYGTTGDEAFVRALYGNVLDRAPDPDGMAVQIGALRGGLSRAQMLWNFADSQENIAKVTADWFFV